MIRTLLALFRPFATIARELRFLRELYEADLGSREKPIYRLTEQASRRDTEVLYDGVAPDKPGYKAWLTHDAVDEGDE